MKLQIWKTFLALIFTAFFFTQVLAVPGNTTGKIKEHCYSVRSRSTVLQGVPFGGVPTVLIASVLSSTALLLLFSVLRRVRDHGRLTLLKGPEELTEVVVQRNEHVPSSTDSASIEQKDKGFFSWITSIFRLTDEQIKKKCGKDALHYLSFQRHLIGLLVAIGLMSLSVILTLNITGDLLDSSYYSFGRTTIANFDAGINFLWLHTSFAAIYLLATLFSMRCHTSTMDTEKEDVVKRTLFITGLPNDATDDEIKQHFEQVYSNCTVLDVNRCFNVSKLMKINAQIEKMEKNKKYYLERQAQHHKPTMIITRPHGLFFYFTNKSWGQEEAVSYYTKLEEKLKKAYKLERKRVNKMPLEKAFVTFQQESTTEEIMKDFNAVKFKNKSIKRRPKKSPLTKKLCTNQWNVSYAPHPKNIFWENLSIGRLWWWCRYFFINSILFLLLFFFTTPTIIMSTMDKFDVTKPVEALNSPIVTQFFPTVLMWLLSTLLPTIVFYSTFAECHWTRSEHNRHLMHKCYTFLVLMVLILPSLGLSSLDVLFRWLFDNPFSRGLKVRFECVFLPDSGAFFVNYVITTAFIGNVMELIRLPNLIVYLIRLCLTRSAAERKNVKRNQAFEFPYGAAYAWMMCVFSVVMSYSIISPVIVPFGLLYLVIRHLADRYKLYYSYLPTKLDKKLHSAAVNQVVAAPMLGLLWLLFFSIVRSGYKSGTSIFTSVVLISALVVAVAHICFGHFKNLSAHNYQIQAKEEDEQPPAPLATSVQAYVAPVFLRRQNVPKIEDQRPPQSSGYIICEMPEC